MFSAMAAQFHNKTSSTGSANRFDDGFFHAQRPYHGGYKLLTAIMFHSTQSASSAKLLRRVRYLNITRYLAVISREIISEFFTT